MSSQQRRRSEHGGGEARDRVGRPSGNAELAARLHPVVSEAVAALGFDVDSLDVQQAGRRRLIKVVVDADEGVDLDEVAKASRVLSAELDRHDDLLAGPYTLEVTSPGVDRPLTCPRHWRRAKLRLVRLRLRNGIELVGRVGDDDGDGVQLLVAGELRRVGYADIDRATVEIEFRQPPASELAMLQGAAKEEPK